MPFQYDGTLGLMNLHIPQGITVTTHDSTKKWWKVGEKKKEHASVHISTLASGSYLSRASGPTTFDILGIKVKVPLTQKSMFSLCIRFMSKVKLKMCICKWFKQHFNKVIQT